MIKGTRVTLRNLSGQDMPLLVQWRNHPESRKWFFDQNILSVEDQMLWFENMKNREDELFFMIQDEDSKPVGTVSIYNIDPAQRSAQFGRMLISPDHRGAGYARDATLTLLTYAFANLPVDRIYLEVMAENKRAAGLYQAAGFSEITRYQKARNNLRYPVILMEIDRSAFQHKAQPRNDQ